MDENAYVPVVLTEEDKAMLNEGIGWVLSRWTAMKAAVDNCWGGRNSLSKAERTITNVFDYFTLAKDPMDYDGLADILEEGLNDLNTVAEDGSVGEVTETLLDLFEECCVGNYQMVENLRKNKPQTSASVVKVSDDNDEESDDEDEDTNNNQTTDMMMVDGSEHFSNQKSEAMPVDEAPADDGWTVVPSRKNKGKKKFLSKAPALVFLRMQGGNLNRENINMAETGEAITKEIPKTSSLIGELEVEVEIKAPAEKFYQVYAGRPDHVAKATSCKVQACDLLEGEWGTVGSIINWKYVYGGKAKVTKDRIEKVEREKKLIKFRVIEGDVLAVYKTFLITIQVTTKEEGDGSMVKWHLEYEKIDEKVADPVNFLPFLAEMTKEIDQHLLSEE